VRGHSSTKYPPKDRQFLVFLRRDAKKAARLARFSAEKDVGASRTAACGAQHRRDTHILLSVFVSTMFRMAGQQKNYNITAS
jgi:hypothetical protein